MKKEILADKNLVQAINCVCMMIDYIPKEEQDTAIKSVLFLDSVDLSTADEETIECYRYTKKLIEGYAKDIEEKLEKEEGCENFFE